MIRKILLTTIVLLAGLTAVSAQGENTADLQRGEVKKLESMVGQWKGSGWIQQGAKRETFTGTETVQRKLDGLALLIEGKFANPEGKVIHETLAVLDFSAKAAKYRFRTYLASGISGEQDFKIVGDGFEWGFQTPAGTIRYTIKTANDVWFEIGEFAKDGKTWMKFFEMKLDRVK
ncbi:MAG TPA: hypothetical protein VNB22_15750 [Pyrinomonadaceae bacterium]|jgi:hypothetical protein|nr:hypothetical protein [Pyrinomonadaceae bacterium]